MFEFAALDLPPIQAKISKEGNKYFIFDVLRRKNVVLTPEEWVRQHWIHYLADIKRYPKSLMQIEGGMQLNKLLKRSDLVVYNNHGNKILLAEFKAPHVKITQKVFEQISNYNSIQKAPVLLVSNGLKHIYSKIDFEKKSYNFLSELPNYELMTEIGNNS